MNREDANSWNVGLEDDRGAILDSFSQKQICKKYVFNLNIEKLFFFYTERQSLRLHIYFSYMCILCT